VQRLLARPSGEASGVSLLSWWRGRCVAHLRIGRRHGGFSRAEIDRLRAFMPQIRLSESLRYVQSKFPASALSERSAACKLSAREREIVSYLGLGYTNEQIAAACGSSVHTVRNQLSRAYAKLGVASRAEAVSVLTSAR
jgi:DNA-binding NarL/FixJ family response regulator